jgi:hypothetical protein
MSTMHHRTRRLSVAVGSAALLVVGLLGGTASAHAPNGVKGDPQPEIAPFRLGAASGSGGTVAMEPNGGLVVVYGVKTSNADGATRVCVLKRGADKCTTTTTLLTEADESMFNIPQVFVVSQNHVVVLMDTCCSNSEPAGGDLLFTSTDGGSHFGAGVRVGDVATSAAELVGSNIVFAGGNAHLGAQVESIPDDATAAPTATALVNDNQPPDVGVGTYKGGVLVGNDIDTDPEVTKVEYAPSTSDFDASGSYTTVASFTNEELIGVSGNAVLTKQTNAHEHLLLRWFNGTGFSAPKAVPGFSNHGIGSWISFEQDPAGVTHVFSTSAFSSPTYHLFETSTRSGASFSTPVDFGNGIDYSYFASSLDTIGSGLAIGVGDGKAEAFPVLATQHVTFALSKSSIKKGHHTVGKGAVTTTALGRTVTLQVEKAHHRWYNVTTTHESGSGKFHFTIHGSAEGTFAYRAVASDRAGYILFGYSPSRSLRVTK